MAVRIQKGTVGARKTAKSAVRSAPGRYTSTPRTTQTVKKSSGGPPIALFVTLGILGVLGVIALICGLYNSYNKSQRTTTATYRPAAPKPVQRKTYQPTPMAELGGMTMKEYQEKHGGGEALDERKKRLNSFAHPE